MAVALVPSILHAQITFERTYGGTRADYGRSVQQTTDGGYIACGYAASFGAGHEDVYLVRTDSLGDTLWTRTFGGAGTDGGTSVQQTNDGGFIVAGSGSFGAAYGVLLIKTDANGDTAWTRTFGGDSVDIGCSVQQTTDSGYIVTGYTLSFGAGGSDVYLIKTGANGDTMWTRTFGGTGNDWGVSVRQTADGGFITTGYTQSYGAGGHDVYLVKTDAGGDTMWTRTIGGTREEVGWSIQLTADSGFIITGSTSPEGSWVHDVYIIKADAMGDTQWTRTYGGADSDEGYSVQQTTDGGYIVVGYTSSLGGGGQDVWLIKTDADGDTLWTRTFGGDSVDIGCSVQQTRDCGYIIAGVTDSYGAGETDVYLIKTDSLGNVAVAEPKTSPTRTRGLTVTCEPNPFARATTICLSSSATRSSPLTLRVYDAQGRAVRSFFSLLSAPFSLTWDGTDELGQPIPSGAYFVRVDAGSEHATTRIVLQR